MSDDIGDEEFRKKLRDYIDKKKRAKAFDLKIQQMEYREAQKRIDSNPHPSKHIRDNAKIMGELRHGEGVHSLKDARLAKKLGPSMKTTKDLKTISKDIKGIAKNIKRDEARKRRLGKFDLINKSKQAKKTIDVNRRTPRNDTRKNADVFSFAKKKYIADSDIRKAEKATRDLDSFKTYSQKDNATRAWSKVDDAHVVRGKFGKMAKYLPLLGLISAAMNPSESSAADGVFDLVDPIGILTPGEMGGAPEVDEYENRGIEKKKFNDMIKGYLNE